MKNIIWFWKNYRGIENTSLMEETIEEIISEIYDYADNLNVDYFIEGKYPKEITDFINDIDSLIDFKNESEYMFLRKNILWRNLCRIL